MCFVGFLGRLSFGYFTKAPKVAYDNLNPPKIPSLLSVKILNPFAFPSKSIRSWYSFSVSSPLYFIPFPVLKYSPIAFSPECPKGGFPIS